MPNRFQEDAVWKSGKFSVDEQGRVWRDGRRAERQTTGGYLQVRVMVGGTRHYTTAHRLVWRALVGEIPSGMIVNHKNGIKDDNRPENLELRTYSENSVHAHRSGLIDQTGERNPASKLTNSEVAQIRLAYHQGGFTMDQLAKRFGVTFQAISKIVRGTRRQKQGGPVQHEDLRRTVSPRDPKTGRFVS